MATSTGKAPIFYSSVKSYMVWDNRSYGYINLPLGNERQRGFLIGWGIQEGNGSLKEQYSETSAETHVDWIATEDRHASHPTVVDWIATEDRQASHPTVVDSLALPSHFSEEASVTFGSVELEGVTVKIRSQQTESCSD